MSEQYTSTPAFQQGVRPATLPHLTPVQLSSPIPNTNDEPKRKPKNPRGQVKRKRKTKGLGRPSTRPWHQKPWVIVNGRRQPVRRTLSDDEFRALLGDKDVAAADARARMIGRPFTHFIVIKPRGMDDLAPHLRKRFWDQALDKLHKAVKRAGAETWTYAVTREADEIANDGTGEHLNLLLHLPELAADRVLAYLEKRFRKQGELDAQTIKQASKSLRNGKFGSVLLYACKNLHPKKTYRRNVHRVRGGPVMGLRGWVSKDLVPEAIRDWQCKHRVKGHTRIITIYL